MQAKPEDEDARLRFYECLAATELFLLLMNEARGALIEPRIFEIEGSRYVPVFDREERLSEFAGGTAPFAALSGRIAAGMLAPEGLGMGVNPDVAPSSLLLPPEAVAWLAGQSGEAAAEIEVLPREVFAPGGLSDGFLTALDARLASAAGLARQAYLTRAVYDEGAVRYLLAFADVTPGAEGALARAATDVMRFSGRAAAPLDVTFLRPDDPALARLARVGLRFDLPGAKAKTEGSAAPGLDPTAPPRLR